MNDGIIIPFGVLDLCNYNELQTPAEAIQEILKLAQLAEQYGYSRYWLAEHHVPYAASSAPELLLPLLAARTQRIRIGTGGTIIRYYSPYKIAEIANTLQTISDGRFDLGLCRGPGVLDEIIAEELVCGNIWELSKEAFIRKIAHTVNLIRSTGDFSERIKIYTPAETKPQLWLLGSSASTVIMANTLEMSLVLSLFITRNEDIIFTNSKLFQTISDSKNYLYRKSILAVSVVCDDTDDKALSRHKKLIEDGNMPSNFVGSYKNVVEKLLDLLNRFNMNELLIVLLSRDHCERVETYHSLAESYKATISSDFINRR